MARSRSSGAILRSRSAVEQRRRDTFGPSVSEGGRRGGAVPPAVCPPDKGGNDVNVELVDLAGVEERGDELSAAHHPDMFSGRCAQLPGKGFHRLRHKFYAGRRAFRRLPRERVMGEILVKMRSCVPFFLA
jgi:hypothetical protein